MAVNIRLSPSLDLAARAYCERVGISLNSLVGVALDAYLQHTERNSPVVERTPSESPVVKPAAPRASPVGVQPTRTASSVTADPKPVLPNKPTKADRDRLAKWYRERPAR